MKRFNTNVMLPGDLLLVRSYGTPAILIRAGLDATIPQDQPRCWAAHVAGYLGTGKISFTRRGLFGSRTRTLDLGSGAIGDARPIFNTHTAIEVYEAAMNRLPGDLLREEVRVFRPLCAGGGIESELPWTPEAGQEAALWWLTHVWGHLYDLVDYATFIQRGRKGTLNDDGGSSPGLRKLHSCATGWNDAYNDICENESATPWTFQKRLDGIGCSPVVFKELLDAVVDV